MCKFKKLVAASMTAVIVVCGMVTPNTASSLTIKEEEKLSVEFLKMVNETYDVIKDPIINNYINDVGHKIISAMPQQPFTYKFYAIREDAYNAFAGPGGNIFIFSGLFCALDNEDELAALFSHEIAHVACRHISEMMGKSKKTNMATMAGVIAGILIGLGGAGTVGSALTVGSMAAGQSMVLAYSRENEMQADQIGQTYLQKAGYSLHGLLSVLKKIRSVDWFDTNEIPTYLKTHPATEERIIYLNDLLGDKETPKPKKNPAFEKAHTRMVALYGDPETALRLFKGEIEDHPDGAMAQYGYGLVLSRKGNAEAAVDHLKIASERNPDDPDFKVDLGIALFLSGDYKNALNILENTSKAAISHNIAALFIGRTQMALGRYEQASETFKALIKEDPENKEVYFFLGESEGKRKQLASAHFYLGQYYMKDKDRPNALFHLNKALGLEKDPKQVEKIKELLKELNPPPHRFFGKDKKEDEGKKEDGEKN